jgi:hypothetical protein
MCEYSLEYIAFRPAKLGDKLVTTRFLNSLTCGFVQVEDPNVAVCLPPGAELAFEKEVECHHPFAWFSARLRQMGAKVARFTQVNLDKSWAHHDALEFPNGKVVLLTRLRQGQRATVLQLPVEPKTTPEESKRASSRQAPSRQAHLADVG